MHTKFFQLMSCMMHKRVSEGMLAKKNLYFFVVDVKDPETGKGFTETVLAAESRSLLTARTLPRLA